MKLILGLTSYCNYSAKHNRDKVLSSIYLRSTTHLEVQIQQGNQICDGFDNFGF